jgi:ribulose-bisphosphate carboxylase small chain
VNIEFTDDPHPRNNFWEMWGLPMFDLRDAAGVMMELNECRKVYGDRYIRLSAFDSSHGWESVRLSFIVNRPKEEPGFRLDRHEMAGRNIRYTTTSYAADRPRAGATVRHAFGPADAFSLNVPASAGCTAPSLRKAATEAFPKLCVQRIEVSRWTWIRPHDGCGQPAR